MTTSEPNGESLAPPILRRRRGALAPAVVAGVLLVAQWGTPGASADIAPATDGAPAAGDSSLTTAAPPETATDATAVSIAPPSTAAPEVPADDAPPPTTAPPLVVVEPPGPAVAAEPALAVVDPTGDVDASISPASAAASAEPLPTSPGERATAAADEGQCNGRETANGQVEECTVIVVNNLDLATGATSSTTTLIECHRPDAGAALTCTTTFKDFSTELVTSVNQCNDSANVGGSRVECSVSVVNNITGTATPTPATVNQCNGSGLDGGANTLVCDPSQANTTNATITQCNGSGNGGGGTMRVRCTVALGSTTASALLVTINQCNGSANGGGSEVICTASIMNNVIAPTPVTPVTPVTPGTPGGPGTPGTPGGPGTSGAPGAPGTPGRPRGPAAPRAPARPGTPGLARTGSDLVPLTLGALTAIALGSLLMVSSARAGRRLRQS